MLIPLGFGNSPKKFPVSIVLMLVAITAASVIYFPKMHQIKKDIAKRSGSLLKNHEKLFVAVIAESCLKRFPGASICIENKKNRKIASKKEKTSLSVLSEQLEFMKSLEEKIENWPLDVKQNKNYPSLLESHRKIKVIKLATYAEQNILHYENINFMSLITSTLVHADWMHLFGNMLLFVLLGMWVEQKIGKLKTTLLFFLGSFAGLTTQVLINTQSPIIGASAGVSAVMGAFFVFFYKKEFTFLLTAVIYYKRISLPIVWIFPFVYFATDLVGAAQTKSDGVGHLAHLGGLFFGMIFGYWQVLAQDLSGDELFPREKVLNKKLLSTNSKNDLWKSFREIMAWNCQNQKSLEVFLKRSHELGLILTKSQQIKFLETKFIQLTHRVFKKDDASASVKWIKLVPDYLSLDNCLVEMQLNHSLALADQCARKSDWETSLKLYQVALKKNPNNKTKKRIQTAITTINELNQESA